MAPPLLSTNARNTVRRESTTARDSGGKRKPPPPRHNLPTFAALAKRWAILFLRWSCDKEDVYHSIPPFAAYTNAQGLIIFLAFSLGGGNGWTKQIRTNPSCHPPCFYALLVPTRCAVLLDDACNQWNPPTRTPET